MVIYYNRHNGKILISKQRASLHNSVTMLFCISLSLVLHYYYCLFRLKITSKKNGDFIQGRSHGAWDGKRHPWAIRCQLSVPQGIFCNFLLLIFFVQWERSPELLDELNLGLSDIIESSIVSWTHFLFIVVT